MTHDTATAYGCVAYRIMKYEGNEQSEENLEVIMENLYEFYTGKEIRGIYQSNIELDLYDVIVNDKKIKSEINE